MKGYLLLVTVLPLLHIAVGEEIDPGIPCKSTTDCISLSKEFKDSNCKNGYCVCKIGNEIKNCPSVEIMRYSDKLMGSLIHRSCKHDQDCNFRRGVCNTTISQCECQKNYVASSDKQSCLQKASSIDSPCVDDKQCLAFLPNTTCQHGRCSCILGLQFVRDTCYNVIGFGFPCTRSEECSQVENAICSDQDVCSCSDKTVINLNRTMCLPVADSINAECKEDVQCSTTFSYALCTDGKCQCRYNHHYEAEVNRCFANKVLQEKCENSFECYQQTDDSDATSTKAVKCQDNTCVCIENYYDEDGNCVSRATYSKLVAPFLLLCGLAATALFSHCV